QLSRSRRDAGQCRRNRRGHRSAGIGRSAIRTVCSALDKPVNVVMGLRGPVYSVEELAAAGVRRISVGGSLARAALGALVRSAQEVRDTGTFNYANDALPVSQIAVLMRH